MFLFVYGLVVELAKRGWDYLLGAISQLLLITLNCSWKIKKWYVSVYIFKFLDIQFNRNYKKNN